MHGFDEFFGNLYHLNAEEEPELDDYPSPEDFPNFRENFGPRGVLHTWANGDGTQRIEDTGPLTKERMETVDDEFLASRLAASSGTRPQAQTRPSSCGSTPRTCTSAPTPSRRAAARPGGGSRSYHDTMIDHDKQVGDAARPARRARASPRTRSSSTRTDNGPHMNSWPDAGTTPFRGEKNTNWEGGYRVPAVVRWPGQIPAAHRAERDHQPQRLVRHLSSPPPVCPTSPTQLKAGAELNGTTYRVHLDGHNQLPYLTGETDQSPRNFFFYVSDDGDLLGLAVRQLEDGVPRAARRGTLQVWAEPFIELRVPKIFNLRTDPYERADITSNTYYDWMLDHAFLLVPAQAFVGPDGRVVHGVPADAGARDLRHHAGAGQAETGCRARDERSRAHDRVCDLVRDPGRDVPRWVGRALPRGGRRCARSRSAAFCDRAHGRHQRAVRRVRRGDRRTSPSPSVRSTRPTSPAPRRRTSCRGRWSSPARPGRSTCGT